VLVAYAQSVFLVTVFLLLHNCIQMATLFINLQGGPKKVSHFQESSLNGTKKRHYSCISYECWV